MKLIIVLLFFLSTVCFPFSLVLGESLKSPSTSAGIIEREIEREYQAKEITPDREVPLLDIDIPEEQLSLDDREKILIHSIHVEGNRVISCKALQKITRAYANKELSMKDIRSLCTEIEQLYVQKGYFLARAYPPPQEIQEGKLTIQVMEGVLGKVSVQGNKHYKTDFILKYFAKYQGKAIHYDELLKTLFLLNENLDLNAGVVFKKGSQVGSADLIVRIHDTRPCHLYVDENNYGSKQTAMYRTGAKFQYGNLIRNGDVLSLTEVVGNPFNRVNYSNASYSIPLNTIGTSMQFGYTYSSFHVHQLEWLKLRGRTQIGSVEVTQALSRTRNFSSDVYLSFDYKQIANYQLNRINSYDKLRVFVLGMDLDYMDALRGRNVGDVYVSCGVPHFLGGLNAKDALSSRGDVAGGLFTILNVDYTRLQTLPKDCFLMLHFSGQATPYLLPLAEQIYIGGFDTVRGFPLAAALGDNGYYANFELRIAPPFIREKPTYFCKKTWKELLQIVGFIDQGGVALNGKGENQKRHISMTGAGVGLRVFAPYRIQFNVDVGFPLTGEKARSSPVYTFKLGVQPF
jgi:hemolysin activation/secretion protein